MTPLERLVGALPSAPADFRDYSDMVSQAIFDASQRDRETFVRVLEEEPTLFESGTIVWALGAVDDERLVPLLSDALRSKDSNVRWSAAHALAKRKSAVPALVDALRDRSATVREVAAEALGDLGDRRALEPLRAALSRTTHAYFRKLLEEAIAKLA